MTDGLDLLAIINRRRHTRKASVVKSETTSKCVAFVLKRMNMAVYNFKITLAPFKFDFGYAKYFDINTKEVSRTISIDKLKPCFFADPAKPTSADKFSTPRTSPSTVSTPWHSQQDTSEQSSKLQMRFAKPPAQYVTRSGRAVHPSRRFLHPVHWWGSTVATRTEVN
ncbi:hypothetical protein TNCV_2586031 [Trichonephila clavipes]|nr:hypothetical protein TNCV_2586031 [Trichonephila clavipes]